MGVSVIMPAFEAAATIREAVASVLAQDYAPLELIVVADDEADYRAVLPADARLVFLRTPSPAAGPSVARNLGLDRARHPFVAFLDSDDVWYPRKLPVLVPQAAQWGIALDNARSCYPSGTKPCRTCWEDLPDGHYDFGLFGQVSQPLWPVLRRDCLGEARFAERLRFAEDGVFYLSLIARNRGAYLYGQPLHEHRLRSGSLSQSAGAPQRATEAYDWVLAQLRAGNALHFPEDTVAEAIAIFEYRKALNQAFEDQGLRDFEAFEAARRARGTGAPSEGDEGPRLSLRERAWAMEN